MGIIPAGTGNDVARQFGIASPLDAAGRIIAGRTSPFDVMKVDAGGETDYCVTLVGWTGVADINATAARLRSLGWLRYAIAALSHIVRAKRRRARLVLDDRTLDDEFCSLPPATRSLQVQECGWRLARKWMTARSTS